MTERVMTDTTTLTQRDTLLLGKLASVVFSVMLGVVILGAVGFAPGMAHNAAHDTRHVMVFPCH